MFFSVKILSMKSLQQKTMFLLRKKQDCDRQLATIWHTFTWPRKINCVGFLKHFQGYLVFILIVLHNVQQ